MRFAIANPYQLRVSPIVDVVKSLATVRMGGRAVEGTGLENRQALTRLVGSNPTPSAINVNTHESQKCRADVTGNIPI